jgi:hypothetical protein
VRYTRIATELLKVARELVAVKQTLRDYATDDEEMADDLEAALSRVISGSSEVNGDEIVFYEESTRKGEMVRIEVTVNPRNQPTKADTTKIGLYITGEDGAPTYEDGIWDFDDDDSVREVAKVIGNAVKRILRKW